MRISDWSSDVCSSDLKAIMPAASPRAASRSRCPSCWRYCAARARAAPWRCWRGKTQSQIPEPGLGTECFSAAYIEGELAWAAGMREAKRRRAEHVRAATEQGQEPCRERECQ